MVHVCWTCLQGQWSAKYSMAGYFDLSCEMYKAIHDSCAILRDLRGSCKMFWRSLISLFLALCVAIIHIPYHQNVLLSHIVLTYLPTCVLPIYLLPSLCARLRTYLLTDLSTPTLSTCSFTHPLIYAFCTYVHTRLLTNLPSTYLLNFLLTHLPALAPAQASTSASAQFIEGHFN